MARPFKPRRRVEIRKLDVPEDIVAVEKALEKVGYYEPPVFGTGRSAPQELDNAIRQLQTDRGLKPDGVIEPDGPTAEHINALLTGRRRRPDNPSADTQIAELRREQAAARARGTEMPEAGRPRRPVPSFLRRNAPTLLDGAIRELAGGAEAPAPGNRRGAPPEPEARLLLPDDPGTRTLLAELRRERAAERAGLGDTSPPGRRRRGLEGMAAPTFRDEIRDPTQAALEEIDSGKGVDREPAVPIILGPPTDAPVSVARMYRKLQFDPRGPGVQSVAWDMLPQGAGALFMARSARAATEDGIDDNKLPAGGTKDNEADAFRHALWSYKMAKSMGYAVAKRITDGHEITTPNPLGSRLMDLYNNEVGRQLAADTSNHGLSDEEVIYQALRKGKLRIKPFNIAAPSQHPGMGGGP